MKEVMESALRYGPRYLEDLLSLVTRPKQWLLALLEQNDALNQAIVFFVISLGLPLLFGLPFPSQEVDIWFLISKHVTFHLFAAISLALIFFLSFAAVGGRARPSRFLIVTFYISGVGFLIWAMLAASAKGVVLGTTPQLYPVFIEFANDTILPITRHDYANPDTFSPLLEGGTLAPLVALLIVYLIHVLNFIWLVACWGAFRSICKVSRVRSFGAFFLTQILGAVLWFLLAPVLVALNILPF